MPVSGVGGRFALVDALNAEWADWERAGWPADRWRTWLAGWAIQEPVLAGCGRLADVLETIRCRPDPVLGALIRLHQDRPAPAAGETTHESTAPGAGIADGELAGRIVLQSMLGKLVLMSRRDPRHDVEDYIAAFWTRLCRYPLHRRPVRIAANLALDTLKDMTRDRDRVQLVPCGDAASSWADGADETGPTMSASRVLHAACDLGVIDDETRHLLSSVYADGLSGRQAAEAFGLAPTTVRYRCSTAVRRLARHAQALAAA